MYEEFPFHPYRQKWRSELKLNIDATTLNRPQQYTEGIIEAIESNKPFVIYHDNNDFLLSIPLYRIVICFAGGVLQTKEILSDRMRYTDRIKLGMVVYDKFSTVDEFYNKFPAVKNVYLLSK